MKPAEEAVVVPLVPLESEPSTEAMLRMLLNREALLIDRTSQSPQSAPSGLIAQSGGAFAKAVGQAMGQLGRSSSSEGLYRVIMPTGSVARDLVPAVGGGFRGLVRGAGGAKIAGQVRLVPAAAGVGATVAAGPLIATVGLAVAGEMLAQHQTQKKLGEIRSALNAIQTRSEEQGTLDTVHSRSAGAEGRRVPAGPGKDSVDLFGGTCFRRSRLADQLVHRPAGPMDRCDREARWGRARIRSRAAHSAGR